MNVTYATQQDDDSRSSGVYTVRLGLAVYAGCIYVRVDYWLYCWL